MNGSTVYMRLKRKSGPGLNAKTTSLRFESRKWTLSLGIHQVPVRTCIGIALSKYPIIFLNCR